MVCLWAFLRGYQGRAGRGWTGAGRSWLLRRQLQKARDMATPADSLSDECVVSRWEISGSLLDLPLSDCQTAPCLGLTSSIHLYAAGNSFPNHRLQISREVPCGVFWALVKSASQVPLLEIPQTPITSSLQPLQEGPGLDCPTGQSNSCNPSHVVRIAAKCGLCADPGPSSACTISCLPSNFIRMMDADGSLKAMVPTPAPSRPTPSPPTPSPNKASLTASPRTFSGGCLLS